MTKIKVVNTNNEIMTKPQVKMPKFKPTDFKSWEGGFKEGCRKGYLLAIDDFKNMINDEIEKSDKLQSAKRVLKLFKKRFLNLNKDIKKDKFAETTEYQIGFIDGENKK